MLGYKKFLPIVLLLAMAGCSTQVVVQDATIPEPLIRKLPISVGAKYPERFDRFVHEELVIGKDKWLIDLGRSNKILFDKLFASMFDSYQVIGAEENQADYGFDAFIEPSIDAFEFSVPEQSQTDAFAVWIRYRIKIFDGSGTQIANWPIAAYGKSQTEGLGSDRALQRAAVLAMRDAAALIILQMDKATGISQLARTAATEPMPPTTADPADIPLQTTAAEENPDDQG